MPMIQKTFNLSDFCYRLYEVMKKKGITQKQLSNDLGYAYITVHQWFHSDFDIPWSRVLAIWELYDISLDYLAYGA